MNEVPYLESTSVSSAPTHAISDSCLNHLETSISSSLHSTPTATALIQACRISCLVVQLYLTLCDPMDYSMSGFPVLNHFLEFARTHVHWVGDDIQPSHPLSSPSPPAFNLSQHQSFPMSLSPSNEYLALTSRLIDLLAVQGTLVFSSTTVQKYQFFSVQPFLLSSSHIRTLEKS